jgi:glutathione S-transferase
LEEYDDGPYFCGEELTAADIYWAPYLERYAAQVPLIHDGDMLEGRYGGRYEAIEEWFNAMEKMVPCYGCRVAGDSVSWENVLKEAVKNGLLPNVDLFPSRGKRVPLNRLGDKTTALWNEYRKTRPYLCETPAMECVAHIVRHRDQILTEAVNVDDLKEFDKDELDQALLETVGALLGRIEAAELSGKAREVVAFLDSRLRVPRDMGMIPAAALRALVVTAPKSTIKG